MGRGSGGTRALTSKMEVKSPLTLYQRAKKAREEALAIAETFKGKPKRFAVDNGIKMDMEMSRQDIKTLVGKNTPDDEFNLLKNEAAKDVNVKKWTCPNCGETHDRDINAAVNIRNEALRQVGLGRPELMPAEVV